jgi:triphosphoribosyl-dephospho-CoA synthase
MDPDAVATALRAACHAELDALKPGNVHRYAPGHQMTVEDFEASAQASAQAMALPGLSVGERIYQAVRLTREAVGCNTNLGIVLLAAPLAESALTGTGRNLRANLERVLAGLDVSDAQWTYKAICLADPAGLGASERHDVNQAPTVGLREAMAEARERDRVARQYATGFADVFDFGLPRLRALMARWQTEPWAAAGVYLGFLAEFPDSHVARKFGLARAEALQRQAAPLAARLEAAGEPTALEGVLLAFDTELKAQSVNPGTSADLTVATLFARRLEEHDLST